MKFEKLSLLLRQSAQALTRPDLFAKASAFKSAETGPPLSTPRPSPELEEFDIGAGTTSVILSRRLANTASEAVIGEFDTREAPFVAPAGEVAGPGDSTMRKSLRKSLCLQRIRLFLQASQAIRLGPS